MTRLKDSFKGFNDGAISKAVAPSETCALALKMLKSGPEPVLTEYVSIRSPSGIPQCRAFGGPRFRRFVATQGANGKGHTVLQSQASALMEMVERYSCFKLLHECKNSLYVTAGSLNERYVTLQELSSLFVANHKPCPLKIDQMHETVPILWYPGYTLKGESVYLPLMLILHIEGTNGMSAGNSIEEALIHGICEVIERHCLGLVVALGLETPRVDVSTIKSPLLKDLIYRVKKTTSYELVIRDFSLNLGIPVIAVIRRVDEFQCLITVGVATHPDEALARALTESSQGNNAQHYHPISNLSKCLANSKIVAYDTLPNISHDNMRIELETVDSLFRQSGMVVMFADATSPELGIPSVYVFINGSKYFEKIVANRNLLSAMVNQCVILKTWDILEQLLKLSTGDVTNTLHYNFCRGSICFANGAYREAVAFYKKVINIDHRDISIVEANLLGRIALAHLAVCYKVDDSLEKSTEVLARLHTLYSDHDFRDIATLCPVPFEVLTEIQRDFEILHILHRRYPVLSHRDIHSKLQTIHVRWKTLCQKSDQLVKALDQGRKENVLTILKGSDELDYLVFALNALYPRIALVFEHHGCYSDAIKFYLEAEFISPQDVHINIALARCYKQTGEYEKMYEQMEKLTDYR